MPEKYEEPEKWHDCGLTTCFKELVNFRKKNSKKLESQNLRFARGQEILMTTGVA